jgi:hypothetical protein
MRDIRNAKIGRQQATRKRKPNEAWSRRRARRFKVILKIFLLREFAPVRPPVAVVHAPFGELQ